jgi:uncharacterized protein (TIGR02246 family)
MRFLSLILLTFMALGCQQATEEAVVEMAPERAAATVEADFEALRADWQSMAEANDAAAVAAMYAEDAVFTDVYGTVYNGREAILGYMEGSFGSASDLMIETTDMVFHGDMVAGYGTFTQTVEGPDGPMQMTGMWQTVSMYQDDGSIQIMLHQSMLPAEQPPA